MINVIFYTATKNLGGVGGFREESYTGLDWLASPTFTEDELNVEISRLQAEYDSQAYARNRKEEYDQLNQFEMQFNDDRDGTTTWVDKINEIKGRHPK